MPRSTRRPLDERARARLREAQREESDAVAAVHAALVNRDGAQAKLNAVIAKHQGAIDDADHALSQAQSRLVSVSGIERAALLLELPVADLRAVLRRTKSDARKESA